MKQVVETLLCDVCGSKEKVTDKIKLQVVFTTEQTEGRSCPNYLSDQKVDLCEHCYNIILEDGEYLFAHGAMGHNTYYFLKSKYGRRLKD